MNNLSSYCGSVDARIGASDKDLPVLHSHYILPVFLHYNFLPRFFRKMADAKKFPSNDVCRGVLKE